jgi:GT2 family glycosyltransferase
MNRKFCLKEMVAGTRAAIYPLSYEFVIADGFSQDGTLEWIEEQRDIHLIQMGARTGAVNSFNAAFKECRGKYIVNLNDDILIHGDIFCRAVEQLEADPEIGQVAIPFRESDEASPKFDFIPHQKTGREWLYANFGVTRKSLGDKLGWWGNYDTYAGDAELSLKIWDAGYKVVKLDGGGYILHLAVQDSTRRGNTDSHKFYDKWKNWEGPAGVKALIGDTL